MVAVDGINFYSPPPADNCHGDIPGQRKEQHGRRLRSVRPRERRLGARNVADDAAFVLGLDAKDYQDHSLQLLEQPGTRRHALGHHLRTSPHDALEILPSTPTARPPQTPLTT